jgi:hypothetical protein
MSKHIRCSIDEINGWAFWLIESSGSRPRALARPVIDAVALPYISNARRGFLWVVAFGE